MTTTTNTAAASGAATIMRFNNLVGLMNPDRRCLYVRYEDHVAALAAPAQPAAQALDAARVFWQQHTQADALSMTMAELHDDVEIVIRAARGAAQAAPVVADVQDEECDVPPFGWRCTREKDHEGPCAAVESPEDKSFVERGMRRIRDAEDAGRYRLLKRGQHWSVIDGAGNTLRAEVLDVAVDAAIAAQQVKQP